MGDRIRLARERLKWSQTDLAKAVGVSQPTVHNIESGQIKGTKYILSFIRALRVNSRWLTTGRGKMEASEPADVRPTAEVPIISSVRAGLWGEASDPFEPGGADAVAYTTKDVGPNGFALRVDGDSMTAASGKSFPEFCVVIVDPRKRSPNDRDFVIAKLNGQDAVLFKQFRRDELGRVWLQPLNPQHSPVREEFSVLGTVVQKVEDV